MDFKNKTLLIGICGGIAAYRACDLIRELQRRGAKRVIALMTNSATQFILPLTLNSLTQEAVYLQDTTLDNNGIPQHIALAQQADAFLILPATTNTIAKLAHGMADNVLTTTAMAFTGKPLLIAPAMNTRMWLNPLTQRNIETLESLEHVSIIRPTSGLLACGETGKGHLAHQETLIHYLYRAIHDEKHRYEGQHVLVTAGGTSEPIDPVRMLTNRSSGKMGVALADELFAMGARVTLIATHSVHAPNLEQRPYSVIRVEDSAELAEAIECRLSDMDWVFMAAAVSDFRVDVAQQKIKRHGQNLDLKLLPTDDILKRMAQQKKPHQRIIGFAAESEALLENAQEKLQRKGLDAIVANDIGREDIGFQSDENEVILLLADGSQYVIDKAPKPEIARQLLCFLSQKLTTPDLIVESR